LRFIDTLLYWAYSTARVPPESVGICGSLGFPPWKSGKFSPQLPGMIVFAVGVLLPNCLAQKPVLSHLVAVVRTSVATIPRHFPHATSVSENPAIDIG